MTKLPAKDADHFFRLFHSLLFYVNRKYNIIKENPMGLSSEDLDIIEISVLTWPSIRPSWTVSGDFSFIAAGHRGLLEAVQRQIPVKILLLYNGKVETTGGQPIPAGLLERVLRGYEEHLHFIHDPTNCGEVESVLKQAILSPELSIVVPDFRESREGTLCWPINVD